MSCHVMKTQEEDVSKHIGSERLHKMAIYQLGRKSFHVLVLTTILKYILARQDMRRMGNTSCVRRDSSRKPLT